MKITLAQTGRPAIITDISIGSPFYYGGCYWTRTARLSGTELQASNVPLETQRNVSTCTFFDEDTQEFIEIELVSLLVEP